MWPVAQGSSMGERLMVHLWKENYSYGTENGENESTTIKYQRKESDPVSTIINHNSGHH